VRKINNKMTETEQEDFGVFLAEKFTSQKNKVAVIHPKKIPRQILSLMVLPFYMVAVWHNFILCKMPNYD